MAALNGQKVKDLQNQVPGTTQYSGQLPEYELGSGLAFGGAGFPTTLYPQASPQLKGIMGTQLGLVDQARAKADQNIAKQQALFKRETQRGLQRSIKDTREDFNRRGLLRSGKRMGAESGLIANANAELAKNRAMLNEEEFNRGQNLENDALNTGLLYTGNAPGLGASALSGTAGMVQNDIADMGAAGSIYGGASEGVGRLIASILASRK